MIDIEAWLRELDEEEDVDIKNNEEYQTKLFEEYILRSTNHAEERKKLNTRYQNGEPVMGEHGLRKELAAFDLSYFGRAYLPHYFIRKSPHFHEELDEIWEKGVMKDLNPTKEARTISRMKGSRNVTAAPRGHAKSTNFTFKDDLHAILYGYKHYIIILSDSSEQAEGFLEDIKTELEENANIIMDFGSLKGDKAWRSGVILTSTNIKVEAIGSGKKVRGRRHRNWRPDLIVLDDIENDENVNTPEQRRKLKSWFEKAVSKAGDTYTDIMYMSSIRAEMSGDTDALLQRLNKLKSLEKRGVLNSIAEGLRTSTVERFQSEKSPEGVGWTPSIRARESGGKTLTDTTTLKTSIHSQADESGLAVGTNDIRAATLQFGDERTIRAILGQLQTTMSGSEAATKYKSFLNQATKAGEALGLQLTDDNNRLLSTPEILEKLKGKYGETIDAVEKKELKDAFGTDEAVAMIDLLYNNVDSLTTGVDDLSASMKQGSSVTKEMAEAINNTPEQKFQVLKQQIHNNAEELGNGLLPAVNDTMDKVSGLIKRGGEWISNNQQTVQTIMNIALKLGVFLVVAGSVMGIVGSLGKLFLSMKNTIGIVKTAVMGLNTAFLASPVT